MLHLAQRLQVALVRGHGHPGAVGLRRFHRLSQDLQHPAVRQIDGAVGRLRDAGARVERLGLERTFKRGQRVCGAHQGQPVERVQVEHLAEHRQLAVGVGAARGGLGGGALGGRAVVVEVREALERGLLALALGLRLVAQLHVEQREVGVDERLVRGRLFQLLEDVDGFVIATVPAEDDAEGLGGVGQRGIIVQGLLQQVDGALVVAQTEAVHGALVKMARAVGGADGGVQRRQAHLRRRQ